MQDFKDLIVWKKAHENVLLTYKLSRGFPKEEQFGLTNQLRRAATSIPTNIAEGAGKLTQKDFAKFLQTSLGSAQEVEYLLLLSYELKYLNKEDYNKINSSNNEVKAMLISLIKKVRG
jgi:four helix bundle protein